ncbi:MAG: response regulator transcription factor [Lachnospiraceae bacterium]|nr:response regulator transcription factor [Lachnospiraceae bacterium]
MKILLAEDERLLAKALSKILEKNNYTADVVYNGRETLDYLAVSDYDAVILDIMMPEMDGITALKEIRKSGNMVPVILLTAKCEVEDKVLGLDSGANDYLAKPFDSRELLARIRSITRGKTEADTKLRMGNISLDRATYELSSPSGSMKLPNKEYQLMEYLLSNPHRIISTDRFIEKVWGYESDVEINTVWVYISYLRRKLTELDADIQIKASRNAGYSLENKDDQQA